ncbi:hypothetical protein [Streptomyces sp. NBC_00691]|uniref:hypothetical protein n=1 Tax=Streptomyces sp. NBC_00691 TaxID=2903671 RepID=UPI002E308E02|nr:hypothetical protein [Streptomyces sp. NBC_00691]
MRAITDRRRKSGRRTLTDAEFLTLMREARAEARRRSFGEPPVAETDFALRSRHAEFGAAAH